MVKTNNSGFNEIQIKGLQILKMLKSMNRADNHMSVLIQKDREGILITSIAIWRSLVPFNVIVKKCSLFY